MARKHRTDSELAFKPIIFNKLHDDFICRLGSNFAAHPAVTDRHSITNFPDVCGKVDCIAHARYQLRANWPISRFVVGPSCRYDSRGHIAPNDRVQTCPDACSFILTIMTILDIYYNHHGHIENCVALPRPVNIADAKARLPELVERAARGEEIVIARNGEPRARLVPLPAARKRVPGFRRASAGAMAGRIRGATSQMTRLLLDTSVLIWWEQNDPRLGGNARAAIQNAESVYVSAASAWEITIKSALGKLRTTRQPHQAINDSGFDELPITVEHAEAVGRLAAHHSDPFDRLIIAAARVEELTIVTSDAQFARYNVPVLDAAD
jgi:prevent-host-death family protein